MRKGLVVILALVLLGRGGALLADAGTGPLSASPDPRPVAQGADVIPLGVAAYPSGIAAGASTRATPVGSVFEATLAVAPTGRSAGVLPGDGRTEASPRHRYLPVLLSLLVPGTGEIYMGYYVRGAVLLAAEATAWTGYAYYNNKGLDSRREYERFADDHWSYGRWVDHHALWRDPIYEDSTRSFDNLERFGPDWDGWPPYHSWHSKEEEKQNYYENIGKYDWFISGWEDWDPDTQPKQSGMRTTYRAMRKKSNDELDNATGFIYLSVAARVVSLVETLLLTRRDDPDSPGETPSSGFSIKTRATGIASCEVALVYRFQ